LNEIKIYFNLINISRKFIYRERSPAGQSC
jgi:hypothetical protein